MHVPSGGMTTPICDFVRDYAASGTVRLHMPGHKGRTHVGCERMDITEIQGADSLWEADGIIRESERNASALFGTDTYYSTEGSSLCIRAMLYLIQLTARSQGKGAVIAAGRNAHRTFVSGVALLDIDVRWLWPEEDDGGGLSYLSFHIMPEGLDKTLTGWERTEQGRVTAVYLTTPDYLGQTIPVAALAEVCHRHGVLLVVDNAHGAYRRFLQPSRHPMDEGADMCCDSAHKTLSALTGGAYLHVAPSAGSLCVERAREAMAMFGSTSPSYLILQSLDAVNRMLSDGYPEQLHRLCNRIDRLKQNLHEYGYETVGDEPIKLTVAARRFGYTGEELATLMREEGIECEFADPDYTVFMMTTDTDERDLERLEAALTSVPRRRACPPRPGFTPDQRPVTVLTPREVLYAPRETVPLSCAVGRILADMVLACPPAVPLVVCGERITEGAARLLAYYGVDVCCVVARQADPAAWGKRS